jgi:hypothetical protein
MGTRGPQPAGLIGAAAYWVGCFPVTRERAGEILGAEVSPATWASVAEVFRDFDGIMALADRRATARSYAKGRAAAEKSLGEALAAVFAMIGNDLTHDMAMMARLEQDRLGGELDCGLTDHLAAAAKALSLAQGVVRSAVPVELTLPTEGAARAALARNLRDVLQGAGISCTVSDRRSLPDDPSEGDLTPFERFLSEAGVHKANSFDALAKWTATALR